MYIQCLITQRVDFVTTSWYFVGLTKQINSYYATVFLCYFWCFVVYHIKGIYDVIADIIWRGEITFWTYCVVVFYYEIHRSSKFSFVLTKQVDEFPWTERRKIQIYLLLMIITRRKSDDFNIKKTFLSVTLDSTCYDKIFFKK